MNPRLCITLALVAWLGHPATAAVPGELHYQGYLTDAEGAPVHCPDAESCPDVFTVTFRAYDTADGETPLWEEVHAGLSVSHGLFNVRLGSQNPLDPTVLGDPTWLGLEINGAGELMPRQRIVSAPFSLRSARAEAADSAALADDADRLGGLDADAYALVSELPGLCVTDDDLAAMNYVNAFGVDEQIAAYLTLGGYVAGPHFSGEWSDLSGVPDALGDGDDDTLGGMSCESGAIARFDGAAWTCSLDQVLTEVDVDAMVENNGYAAADALAAVAVSGSYLDLSDTPALADALTLTDAGEVALNEIPLIDASGAWIGSPTGLQGPKGDDGAPGDDGTPGTTGDSGVGVADVEVDVAGQLIVTLTDGTVYQSASLIGPQGDPGSDGALAGLTCADGQIVKRVGDTWACAPDTVLDEAQVDAMTTNNGYATEADLEERLAGLAPVAHTGLFGALDEVPAGLDDGDDDTLGALDCPVGHVARRGESGWECAPSVTGQLPTSPPAECDESTVGTMYFDVTQGSLRVCDGTAYRKIKFCSEVCPIQATVACGSEVVDDCGDSCEALGTGLNVVECPPQEALLCGTVAQDSCDNACPQAGTAFNAAQCADPADVACGEAIADDCGNDCEETGTRCAASGEVCDSGSCRLAESCAELHALDASIPSGSATILPPGGSETSVVCEMVILGGGWTRIATNRSVHGQSFNDTSHYDPPGDMSYDEVLLIHTSGNAVAGPAYPGSHPGSTPIIIEVEGSGWHGGVNTGGSDCGFNHTKDFGNTFDPDNAANLSFQLGDTTTARLRVATLEGIAGCTTSDNSGPANFDLYVR